MIKKKLCKTRQLKLSWRWKLQTLTHTHYTLALGSFWHITNVPVASLCLWQARYGFCVHQLRLFNFVFCCFLHLSKMLGLGSRVCYICVNRFTTFHIHTNAIAHVRLHAVQMLPLSVPTPHCCVAVNVSAAVSTPRAWTHEGIREKREEKNRPTL